jgi:hypothetical protein
MFAQLAAQDRCEPEAASAAICTIVSFCDYASNNPPLLICHQRITKAARFLPLQLELFAHWISDYILSLS